MITETREKPSRRIGILLPEDVFERGKEMAKLERRSFSNYIAYLLDRAANSKKDQERDSEQITNAA